MMDVPASGAEDRPPPDAGAAEPGSEGSPTGSGGGTPDSHTASNSDEGCKFPADPSHELAAAMMHSANEVGGDANHAPGGYEADWLAYEEAGDADSFTQEEIELLMAEQAELMGTGLEGQSTQEPRPEGKASAKPASASSYPRRRGHLRRASNAPKRFKSSYIFFCMERYAKIKATLPERAKATDIFKMIADEWRSLPVEEKQRWDKTAVEDRQRYEREMAAFTGPMHVPTSRKRRRQNGMPKRAMPAFLHYSKEERRRSKSAFKNMENTLLSKVLAQRWRNMADEEKQPYREMEKKDFERYRAEISVWTAQQHQMEQMRERRVTQEKELIQKVLYQVTAPLDDEESEPSIALEGAAVRAKTNEVPLSEAQVRKLPGPIAHGDGRESVSGSSMCLNSTSSGSKSGGSSEDEKVPCRKRHRANDFGNMSGAYISSDKTSSESGSVGSSARSADASNSSGSTSTKTSSGSSASGSSSDEAAMDHALRAKYANGAATQLVPKYARFVQTVNEIIVSDSSTSSASGNGTASGGSGESGGSGDSGGSHDGSNDGSNDGRDDDAADGTEIRGIGADAWKGEKKAQSSNNSDESAGSGSPSHNAGGSGYDTCVDLSEQSERSEGDKESDKDSSD